MANKNIYSRMQQKHDIEANWNKAVNFIPMVGELIVYDTDDNYDYERIKIGDGATTVINLPFVTDPTVPAWAKAASKPTYTAAEVGAAPASHKQSADSIEGGTLSTEVLPVVPVEKGGTGADTIPGFLASVFPTYGQTDYILAVGTGYVDCGYATPEQLRVAMGAVTEAQVTTMINNTLGVIENGSY